MRKEALLCNAPQKWLRLEEKLSAQPTDEVSRRVKLNFMKIVIAAWNVSFKEALLRNAIQSWLLLEEKLAA